LDNLTLLSRDRLESRQGEVDAPTMKALCRALAIALACDFE
jgi:mRNA-degrading endonuclease toxin of MazEF toxin-antitoxin module